MFSSSIPSVTLKSVLGTPPFIWLPGWADISGLPCPGACIEPSRQKPSGPGLLDSWGSKSPVAISWYRTTSKFSLSVLWLWPLRRSLLETSRPWPPRVVFNSASKQHPLKALVSSLSSPPSLSSSLGWDTLAEFVHPFSFVVGWSLPFLCLNH